MADLPVLGKLQDQEDEWLQFLHLDGVDPPAFNLTQQFDAEGRPSHPGDSAGPHAEGNSMEAHTLGTAIDSNTTGNFMGSHATGYPMDPYATNIPPNPAPTPLESTEIPSTHSLSFLQLLEAGNESLGLSSPWQPLPASTISSPVPHLSAHPLSHPQQLGPHDPALSPTFHPQPGFPAASKSHMPTSLPQTYPNPQLGPHDLALPATFQPQPGFPAAANPIVLSELLQTHPNPQGGTYNPQARDLHSCTSLPYNPQPLATSNAGPPTAFPPSTAFLPSTALPPYNAYPPSIAYPPSAAYAPSTTDQPSIAYPLSAADPTSVVYCPSTTYPPSAGYHPSTAYPHSAAYPPHTGHPSLAIPPQQTSTHSPHTNISHYRHTTPHLSVHRPCLSSLDTSAPLSSKPPAHPLAQHSFSATLPLPTSHPPSTLNSPTFHPTKPPIDQRTAKALRKRLTQRTYRARKRSEYQRLQDRVQEMLSKLRVLEVDNYELQHKEKALQTMVDSTQKKITFVSMIMQMKAVQPPPVAGPALPKLDYASLLGTTTGVPRRAVVTAGSSPCHNGPRAAAVGLTAGSLPLALASSFGRDTADGLASCCASFTAAGLGSLALDQNPTPVCNPEPGSPYPGDPTILSGSPDPREPESSSGGPDPGCPASSSGVPYPSVSDSMGPTAIASSWPAAGLGVGPDTYLQQACNCPLAPDASVAAHNTSEPTFNTSVPTVPTPAAPARPEATHNIPAPAAPTIPAATTSCHTPASPVIPVATSNISTAANPQIPIPTTQAGPGANPLLCTQTAPAFPGANPLSPTPATPASLGAPPLSNQHNPTSSCRHAPHVYPAALYPASTFGNAVSEPYPAAVVLWPPTPSMPSGPLDLKRTAVAGWKCLATELGSILLQPNKQQLLQQHIRPLAGRHARWLQYLSVFDAHAFFEVLGYNMDLDVSRDPPSNHWHSVAAKMQLTDSQMLDLLHAGGLYLSTAKRMHNQRRELAETLAEHLVESPAGTLAGNLAGSGSNTKERISKAGSRAGPEGRRTGLGSGAESDGVLAQESEPTLEADVEFEPQGAEGSNLVQQPSSGLHRLPDRTCSYISSEANTDPKDARASFLCWGTNIRASTSPQPVDPTPTTPVAATCGSRATPEGPYWPVMGQEPSSSLPQLDQHVSLSSCAGSVKLSAGNLNSSSARIRDLPAGNLSSSATNFNLFAGDFDSSAKNLTSFIEHTRTFGTGLVGTPRVPWRLEELLDNSKQHQHAVQRLHLTLGMECTICTSLWDAMFFALTLEQVALAIVHAYPYITNVLGILGAVQEMYAERMKQMGANRAKQNIALQQRGANKWRPAA